MYATRKWVNSAVHICHCHYFPQKLHNTSLVFGIYVVYSTYLICNVLSLFCWHLLCTYDTHNQTYPFAHFSYSACIYLTHLECNQITCLVSTQLHVIMLTYSDVWLQLSTQLYLNFSPNLHVFQVTKYTQFTEITKMYSIYSACNVSRSMSLGKPINTN